VADIKSGKSVPANFDWVNARAKCSLQEVFKELEQGVRVDVEAANGLVSAGDALRFSVTKSFPKHFTVNRIDDPIRSKGRAIDFIWSDSTIEVRNQNNEALFTASLTLNNEGRCKLKVGDQELEAWQFRRMALERLFFGPFDPIQTIVQA
jgi:hypothetical protein